MEYGSLHIRIEEILQERNISKNKICKDLFTEIFLYKFKNLYLLYHTCKKMKTKKRSTFLPGYTIIVPENIYCEV